MFDAIRRQVLRFAKVPAEPQPPAGAPGSVRVFRAGRNYLKLRLARWGVAQLGALAGVLFSMAFLHAVDREVTRLRNQPPPAAATPVAPTAPTVDPATTATEPAVSPPPKAPKRKLTKAERDERNRLFTRNTLTSTAEFIRKLPWWAMPLIKLFELLSIGAFIAQFLVTLAALRLEFEQHWYIVTDRSLRIRTGLWSMQERTMSFANVQQVTVSQGPLQRVLGLADVQVQSAGGGEGHGENQKDHLHTGVFHSVENAHDVRDLILARLRHFREAGLGDPDDAPAALTSESPKPDSAVDAARELLGEVRALRTTLRA